MILDGICEEACVKGREHRDAQVPPGRGFAPERPFRRTKDCVDCLITECKCNVQSCGLWGLDQK